MDFLACGACGTFNHGAATHCQQCHAPIEEPAPAPSPAPAAALPAATVPAATIPAATIPMLPLAAPSPIASTAATRGMSRPTAGPVAPGYPSPTLPRRPEPVPSWRDYRVLLGAGVVTVALAFGARALFFAPPERLIGGDLSAHTVEWSPDGRLFAFVIDRATGLADLAVYDVVARTHRVVARVTTGTPPYSWSPDGRRLAFAVSDAPPADALSNVMVLSLDTGTSRKIRAGSDPMFTPDGQSLLMVCRRDPEPVPGAEGGDSPASYQYRPPQLQRCRVDADTGEVEWLRGSSVPMEVSALQQKVAYAVHDGRSFGSNVAVVDLITGEERYLSREGRAGHVAWLADGRVVYDVDGDRGPQLIAAEPDGSREESLVSGVGELDARSISLSRDGRRVYFAARVPAAELGERALADDGPFDLHVLDRTTRKVRRLVNVHPFKHRFAISPDGRRAVYEVVRKHELSRDLSFLELWLMKL